MRASVADKAAACAVPTSGFGSASIQPVIPSDTLTGCGKLASDLAFRQTVARDLQPIFSATPGGRWCSETRRGAPRARSPRSTRR